jgi:hypothetical protein
VVTLESVGENFVINFPGSQFQAQQAPINLLRKSGLLGHFWTINQLKKLSVLTEEKLDMTEDRLEHMPHKSLRHLAQETSISKLSAAKVTKC